MNKIILIGRIGKDPEHRVSASGMGMTTLSLATSDRVKDKASGEYKEEADWHRVLVFGKTADFARDHIRKGDLVSADGKMKYSKYQDKATGQDRTMSQVIANSLQLLTKSPRNEDPKPIASGKPVWSAPSAFDDSDIPF